MSDSALFEQALQAIDQGQPERAKDLLTRLLREEKNNPTYWLWMSSLVETQKEQIYCLQQVLNLDPENVAAREGLVLLGAVPPDEHIQPAPILRRKWEADLSGIQGTDGTPREPLKIGFRQTILLAAMGILVIGLIFVGLFGDRRSSWLPFSRRLTVTPIPWTATATIQPAFSTQIQPTATPVFRGPTPLTMLLKATYTPTPLYVNTPHVVSEAYRSGLRAYQRGNLESALEFFTQAVEVEPQAADLQYYLGETYRALGNYSAALTAFNASMQIDDRFAPAYLGLARTRLALDSDEDIEEELDTAIVLDPNLSEAYLERVSFALSNSDTQSALDDLEILDALIPGSPLLHLYLAQTYLYLEQAEDALQEAQTAYRLDITNPAIYRVLGLAYLENAFPQQAIEALDVYVRINEQDGEAWYALAQAYYQSEGDADLVIEALDNAIQLEQNLAEAYALRGELRLANGEGQAAVNDFVQARRLNPDSFEISLGFSQALFIASRFEDANAQINATENLAADDEQQAAIHFWRAQIQEALGNSVRAVQEWQALLDLPERAVNVSWLEFAQERLLELRKPTATFTPTSTNTRTPTSTQTPSSTPTSTRTPTATRTSTPTRTLTPTPSRTPLLSPTPGG